MPIPATSTWFEVADDVIVPKAQREDQLRSADAHVLCACWAAAKGARAWTEPYTFFKSYETGITCAGAGVRCESRASSR